jgi:hypothetical protein
VRVVKAASQINGVNIFYLTLEAMDAGEKKTYYAKVYDRFLEKRNELIFFRLFGEKPLNLFVKPKGKFLGCLKLFNLNICKSLYYTWCVHVCAYIFMIIFALRIVIYIIL